MNLAFLSDPIDRVFDRGSFVAIERKDRKRYANLMLSLMSSKFRYLLAAVEYDPVKFAGPPRNVNKDEVTEYFVESGIGIICKSVSLVPKIDFESQMYIENIII